MASSLPESSSPASNVVDELKQCKDLFISKGVDPSVIKIYPFNMGGSLFQRITHNNISYMKLVLDIYDKEKGIRRLISGDSAAIKQLKKFYNTHKTKIELGPEELEELKTILQEINKNIKRDPFGGGLLEDYTRGYLTTCPYFYNFQLEKSTKLTLTNIVAYDLRLHFIDPQEKKWNTKTEKFDYYDKRIVTYNHHRRTVDGRVEIRGRDGHYIPEMPVKN